MCLNGHRFPAGGAIYIGEVVLESRTLLEEVGYLGGGRGRNFIALLPVLPDVSKQPSAPAATVTNKSHYLGTACLQAFILYLE